MVTPSTRSSDSSPPCDVPSATQVVMSRRFHQIFHRAPTSESLSVVHALANKVVELAHKDGSVVRALMRRSALMSADDQFARAAFQDLPERSWKVCSPPRC